MQNNFILHASPALLLLVTIGFDLRAIWDELIELLGDEMNCEIDFEYVQDDKNSASFYAG